MIWLIGCSGMLGSEVESLLKRGRFVYEATDAEVDVTDGRALGCFAAGRSVDWIINCSGYTAVDRAEDERELAFAVNADGVLNITRVAAEKGARLVHVSTDFVFDGANREGYVEDDPTGPICVYGASKLAGERHITGSMTDYFILRTAWLHGAKGNNFVRTMLRLFGERDEVGVVADQWGSPTYTRDLAFAIMAVIGSDSHRFGIYHFSNEGRISRHEFAAEIYALGWRYGLTGRDVRITPIATAEYPARARRPVNSYLSKEKIRRELGIEIRGWKEALEDCIRELAGL
jgi:dTDP-4-dehydrorhamnose reductase